MNPRLLFPKPMRWKAALAGCFGFATALASGQGETLLDLRFDDPHLILEQATDIAALSSALARENTTVASGHGGRAVPLLFPKAPESPPEAQGFAKITEPEAGVRITFGGESKYAELGLGIQSDEISFYKEDTASGHANIHGAIDFFLKVGAGSGTPQFNFWAYLAPMTIVMRVDSKEGMGLSARLVTKDSVLKLPNAPDKRATLTSRNVREVPFELDQVMHVALAFKTAADGAITVQIFSQKGTGPMKADAETLNAEIGPFFLEAAPDFSKSRFVLRLNKAEGGQTLDALRFRAFSTPPDLFPGLN